MNVTKFGLKVLLALILIFAAFALILVGVNSFTAPIIEKNSSALSLGPLMEVMPDAAGFEAVYDAASPASPALTDVPATVQSIYRESSGLGYVMTLSTTEGYTREPIVITLAVDAAGKISGVEVNSYPDTKDFGTDYPSTYIGQDSALSEVNLVAGVTYSSSAFKNAVSDGLNALISNGLITAGVKGDEQLLIELMSVVYPGIANTEGAAQYEEQEIAEGKYSCITQSFRALNGGGMAYIADSGGTKVLAVCSVSGSCRVYDTNGNDITADADSTLIDEVKADAAAVLSTFTDKDIKKLGKLVGDSAEFTELSLDGVFNSVTGAYLISHDGSEYYGFAARNYGYSNLEFTTYYVLDSDGAIVAMTADEFILIPEYFSDYKLDENSYREGFVGLTRDSWTGEQALISGATVSSKAVSAAVDDVFEAFAAISENGG